MEPVELTLDDMLADPIVRQLMARDGVAEADLRDLVARVPPRSPIASSGSADVPLESKSFESRE